MAYKRAALYHCGRTSHLLCLPISGLDTAVGLPVKLLNGACSMPLLHTKCGYPTVHPLPELSTALACNAHPITEIQQHPHDGADAKQGGPHCSIGHHDSTEDIPGQDFKRTGAMQSPHVSTAIVRSRLTVVPAWLQPLCRNTNARRLFAHKLPESMLPSLAGFAA